MFKLKKSIALLSIWANLSLQQGGVLEIEWNRTHTFGPDGPWQAAVIGIAAPIGAITNSTQIFNLLPGLCGTVTSAWISVPATCSGASAELNCGIGGTIALSNYQNLSSYFYNGKFTPPIPSGYHNNCSGYDMPTVGGTFVTATTNSTTTYPNGKTLPAQLGFLSVGYPQDGSSVSYIEYLYSEGNISSNSFALSYGSAAFNYTGSLILGGVDRNRGIAPVITYTFVYDHAAPVIQGLEINNITIGVEAGASPFPFQEQQGLLHASSTISEQLYVFINAQYPYILLPEATVQAITSLLPVQLDACGYYLWNTDDPLYERIVSSAAWLGFVFQSNTGPPSTIKVPFALLNLTLEPTVTGYSENRFYLPILASSDTTVTFGRAFLQAAYIGANWDTSEAWLAQASGPGALSPVTMTLEDSAPTPVLANGADIFLDSWEGFWTPLASSSSTSSPTQTLASGSSTSSPTQNPAHFPSSSTLSGGAIAGIVVDAAVVIGLAGVLLALDS